MIIGVFANYGNKILGIRIDCCYIIGMTTGLEYGWVEAMRRVNIAKNRGVDFTAMERFEWDTAVIGFDNNHPEPRWIATGFIGDVLHLVVYTGRGDRIRTVSLRKATPKEMGDHAQT